MKNTNYLLGSVAVVPPATGGTITVVGSYTYHTFTASGTFTPGKSGNVEYLVVAGGGGGGGDGYGGGGGAGGLRTATGFAVTAAIGLTVTVGGGAAGGTTGNSGSDGSASVFGSISTVGGGGGGQTSVGRLGGSGGGASSNNEDLKAAGAGTSGEGNAGGTSAYYGGGGGGGKGSVGTARGTYAPGGSGYDASSFQISNTTTDERYSTSGNNSALAGATWKGQSFTPSFSYTIKKIKLWMKRTGTPVGTVTVQVYATSSNLPTGAALASGTFNGDNLGTSYAWIEFDLGAGAALTGGTVYAYSVDARNASGTSADIIYQNNTYGAGKGCQSANSGSSWANWDSGGDDQDTSFEIWGASGFIAGGGGGAHSSGAGMAGPGRAGGGYGSTQGITQAGSAGLVNTGGGGGGGSSASTGSGSAGASGIVVIKYLTGTV